MNRNIFTYLICILIFISSVDECFSQSQLLSTGPGKNCRIDMASGPIKNNLFDITLKATWVTAQLTVTYDTVSLVCIDRDQLIKSLPVPIRLVSPSSTAVVAFNSTVVYTFEIDEMYKGGKIGINFPFAYSPGRTASSGTLTRQEFLFKRPKINFCSINIDSLFIIHKIGPDIVVITPEGIEEGMKPIVDTTIINVQIYAKDVAGIERVSINNTPAVQINDSAFSAEVRLKVGFENPITIVAVDKKGLTAKRTFSVECRKPEATNVAQSGVPESHVRKPSDVDVGIPETAVPDPNRFALIIGNEDYSSFQPSLKTESNVDYAIHDAEVFREYALKIVGIPNENIILVLNGKAMEMHQAIGQINSIAKNMQGKAEIYVFYAGHGFPDEKTKEPYLMPVDVTGTSLQFAIKQSDLFKKITEYPTKRIVVFLDACFSGGGRNQGLLASRGVMIKPKDNLLKGNIVVFSSSSGEQSSLPYAEKQHGIFTYFLLKKLKDTQGSLNLKELSDYLSSEVGIRSVMVNNKEQNPQTRVSYELGDSWKNWTLK